MNTRETMDLAVQVARFGSRIAARRHWLSDSALNAYWSASKCRLDRWSQTLRKHRCESAQLGPRWTRASWLQLRPVLEEILVAEVLARVWAAVAKAYDQQHEKELAEPIARSVLLGQFEARNRVLNLLVHPATPTDRQADYLNNLRSRCERWTDVLIGQLATAHNVEEFAVDVERARDFAEGFARQQQAGLGDQAWNLTHASLRTAFIDLLAAPVANPDLNQQVAATILSCFPADQFESTGLLQSTWLTRMQALANDTAGMIEDLIALEHGTPRPASRNRSY